jgi:hypothetical protein
MLFHFGDGELRDMEEARYVDGDEGRVVFRGIAGEGLGDEDAGVVDQRVDAAKTGDGFGNHPLRSSRIGDVASHGQDAGVIRRLDRACCCDHAIVEFAKRVDQFAANALRCTGNDDDFL